MRTDSDRMTSTCRASNPIRLAISVARDEGRMPASATTWPSALETIFWVTMTTSPSSSRSPMSVTASSMSLASGASLPISGSPVIG